MGKIKKLILVFLALLLIFFLAGVFLSFRTIYRGVKTNCQKARNEYGGDCVSSLLKSVQSEDKTIREKNSAVWALGQLADKRALPFLYELGKSLPEQKNCDRGQYLCKYEIQKAIEWCERGNVTSWMYENL